MSKVKKDSVSLWEEIKNLKVNMFALPDQFVHSWCELMPGTDTEDSCLLKYKAQAFLPALEESLGKIYTVTLHNKYLEVKRVKE